MQRIAALLTVTLCLAGSLAADDNVPPKTARDKAEALFRVYADEEGKFDPAVADLFADDAVIRNRRVYPDGRVRELALPAPQYKELIRAAMPLAKQRGDTNKYTDCKYAVEGARVRLACTRYSHMKKYASPISLLVGPGKDGRWLIFEELSESRP